MSSFDEILFSLFLLAVTVSGVQVIQICTYKNYYKISENKKNNIHITLYKDGSCIYEVVSRVEWFV